MTTASAAFPTIAVLVNGEERQLPAGCTVSALLTELGYTTGSVAVERNREVVPRRAHGDTQLQAGDEIEVVTFVGGG
jgi:sulfur carrier protein